MRQLKILLLLIILTAAAAFLPVTAGAAQKPKLNLTKVTLPVKTGSYSNHMYLWLKGTKKKVKWTTSNKKIVSINKTYDKYCISIMTHKKGKATITAQVGKKKYKCKVTVKKAMSKAKLKKLISVDTSTIQQQYITFKNKSKDYYLSVHGKIHLYDSKGVQTDWDEPHVHLKPGQSVRVCIRNLHQHPKAKFTTENVYIDYEYHPIKATAKKQPVTGENNLPVLVTNKSYYKESLYYVVIVYTNEIIFRSNTPLTNF